MTQAHDELQTSLLAVTEAFRTALAAFPADGSYDAEAVSTYLEAAHQQQLIQLQLRELQ